MRDLGEININDNGKPVDRLPPSEEQIARFEHRYNVTLPAEYVQMLLHSNGGHPEVNSFIPVNLDGSWGIDEFYWLGGYGTYSVDEAIDRWGAVLGDRKIPIGRDGGDNQVFLDLSVASAPVRLCIHDEDFRVIDVAPSFGAFIDLLHINPDCR